MAPDSQMVMPVFGSSMAGTRPLGLILTNDSALGLGVSTYQVMLVYRSMVFRECPHSYVGDA